MSDVSVSSDQTGSSHYVCVSASVPLALVRLCKRLFSLVVFPHTVFLNSWSDASLGIAFPALVCVQRLPVRSSTLSPSRTV